MRTIDNLKYDIEFLDRYKDTWCSHFRLYYCYFKNILNDESLQECKTCEGCMLDYLSKNKYSMWRYL